MEHLKGSSIDEGEKKLITLTQEHHSRLRHVLRPADGGLRRHLRRERVFRRRRRRRRERRPTAQEPP